MSKADAPDPARSYERARPEAESGMGRLDNNIATPTDAPDRQEQAVPAAQKPRQINAEEIVDERASEVPGEPPPARTSPPLSQPSHSMHEEEPDGWDQAPNDIHDPKQKRHPRKEGKGGTP